MTNDPTIREQSYRYFLQEAPELLQVLEQDLLSLQEDYSINKVNNLMRTTHTLKGAAASIGLETIKTVAHSLEDIFKALFNPSIEIDSEVEALLFEGYECLRLPLIAELTGGQVNNAEVLDRTAAVFAQLQEKLGDCFGQEAHIPSSVELGFDLTQSIFEVGVSQRLDEIAQALASDQPAVVATTLQTHAEVFIGLAESLNLPGFMAIAQAAIAALDAHPEQALTIARTALSDLLSAQTAVLNGDRSQGGQPSLTLQRLGRLHSNSIEIANTAAPADPFENVETQNYANASGIASLTHHFANASLQRESQNDEESANPLLEVIWGGEAVLVDSQASEPGDLGSAGSVPATSHDQEELNPTDSEVERRNFASLQGTAPTLAAYQASLLGDEPEVPVTTPSFPNTETDRTSTPIPQNDRDSLSRTVRVNVEHLQHLNYSVGELLTNQNRQLLQNEQLRVAVRELLARFQHHQQLLEQLQDWSFHLFVLPEQQRTVNRLQGERLKVASSKPAIPLDRFDSLELDRYSESQILVQSILEDAVQLSEAAGAIDLFTQQAHHTLEKQRRLLTSTRDTLMEARMLPLGDVFSRFPSVLKQLAALHNKPVVLELRGNEVSVDKVVVEKLYSPLLHLVRNAFDHGIESPTLRQQRGKPQKGLIEISAYHRGRFLLIEVRDDGQGLNFEGIRQQAVERQLVSPEQASGLSATQLTNLLFEPGFSTVSAVNDLSGRGIGLDVVRAQLQALQGSVTVYSEPNRGTTFVLEIPLSLTIAKLLLVQAGDRIYALLTNAIEQILIPQADQLRCWEGGKALRWGKGADERFIPVHGLAEVLDYSFLVPEPLVGVPQPLFISKGQAKSIILLRSQDQLLGLEVDQLLGEQELVIRPLGAMIVPPNYVYGGSILADGRLTLVLDGAALMQYVFEQQTHRSTDSQPLEERESFASRYLTSSTLPILPSSKEHPRQLPAQTRAALPALAPASDFQASPVNLFKTVLIVDDSITLRQALALTLQKANYRVLQAKDGYEALEQLRHHQEIQLVLCDIEMPRMNGFEFLKHHQQDPALANIPVAILTSRSGEKHRLIALELGATAYITKPFLEHQLLATVKDVIEKNLLNAVSV